jgi:hypothetical protein
MSRTLDAIRFSCGMSRRERQAIGLKGKRSVGSLVETILQAQQEELLDE